VIHHERARPPLRDFPPDEWNLVENRFHPEFLAQLETIMALGNGYLGMRGCPEEGGPVAENGVFVNGFYETRPIFYAEEAYGFPKTGQTILGVTDGKIIKLFVDDEPFWLPNATLLRYERRLNMKSGTLDREIVWETPAGKQVSITSRRLVSFAHRHVAAISYRVALLNAEASLVISSELVAKGEVELGIVAITQTYTTPGVELGGPLPSEIQIYTSFGGAVSATSKSADAARDLLIFLKGPRAVSVIKAQGMDPI